MIDIVFLGTGAAIPTRQRNLSGVVAIRNGEYFLFDCGEGTQTQFRLAELKPGKLRYICISHFHGDHLFGLPGLLTSLHLLGCKQEIHLFGPHGIREYLEFHQRLCAFKLDFPLQIHEITPASPARLWEEREYRLEWQPLEHRIFTAGFALIERERPGKFDVVRADELGVPDGPARGQLQHGEHIELPNGRTVTPAEVLGPPRPGLKLAYCLDTSPCPGMETLAANADALIADATFPHTEQERARQTGHSTGVEAARLAHPASVKRLFLTHFSGTIGPAELEAIAIEVREVFPSAEIATDLARFTINTP